MSVTDVECAIAIEKQVCDVVAQTFFVSVGSASPRESVQLHQTRPCFNVGFVYREWFYNNCMDLRGGV
jgi:hypothetical protein